VSRDIPTPFATRQVLRGLALGLRLAEARAARDQAGYVAPDPPPLTAADMRDVERARAWLTEAAGARRVLPPTNGRHEHGSNGRVRSKTT
jgi:hypothetical protein